MPGGSPRALISGLTGTRPGTRTPARGLPTDTEPSSRAVLPKPAWLASNLLDTDLTALKTYQRNVGGFLTFLFLDAFFSFLVV